LTRSCQIKRPVDCRNPRHHHPLAQARGQAKNSGQNAPAVANPLLTSARYSRSGVEGASQDGLQRGA
jgi:hypothetical protein